MNAVSTGLLLLRLVVGIGLAAHGAQKLFGWWGGSGIRGLLGHLTHMRFRPAPMWVAGAIGTEVGGGTLLALGLLSPLGSVGVGAAMLMAIAAFHWGKGFFGQGGGFETPLLYLVAAATLGITGPGSYSLELVVRDQPSRARGRPRRSRPGCGWRRARHGWAPARGSRNADGPNRAGDPAHRGLTPQLPAVVASLSGQPLLSRQGGRVNTGGRTWAMGKPLSALSAGQTK